MTKERLDKVIASMGQYSRREVKALVKEGLVLVDGRPARAADDKVDPERAVITVNGEDLGYRRFTYLMMHKPGGVLSATEDSRQETVLDLLPPELRKIGLFPVGRLDKDTEGLLLLTNDGDLAHRLLSPKKHVDKVYYTEVDGDLSQADVEAFARGIELGQDGVSMPAGLKIGETPRQAFVTLHEGKFHQIKRMFLSRGRTVLYLKRLSMGSLQLDTALEKGNYRYLTAEEIDNLQRNR